MCTPLELKASPLEKWALACPCSSAGRKGEKGEASVCVRECVYVCVSVWVCVYKWPYSIEQVILSWSLLV